MAMAGPPGRLSHNVAVITAVQMRELRAELLSAGVFRHHEAASWAKLAFFIAALGACVAGTIAGPLWLGVLLVPLGAVFAASAAMLGHEGSHRSFSASPAHNAIFNHIAFPLLSGLGAHYWRHKHDGAHHGHPNVEPDDPDIALWPMTSSAQGHARSSRFRRWFQRHFQGYAFWPLTLFLPIMMRTSSVVHLVRHARRRGIDRGWIADVACLTVHYTTQLVIPALVWGVGPALVLYMALWTIVGMYLALVFAPAHMGMPVVIEQNNDWLHQLETTRNLRLPRVLRFFFIGLDYQIEHHLFPKIPHQELPRAAAVVSAWCARHGLPHHEIGYGDALVDVTRFMRDAWKIPARTGADVRAATVGGSLADAA